MFNKDYTIILIFEIVFNMIAKIGTNSFKGRREVWNR